MSDIRVEDQENTDTGVPHELTSKLFVSAGDRNDDEGNNSATTAINDTPKTTVCLFTRNISVRCILGYLSVHTRACPGIIPIGLLFSTLTCMYRVCM